ncbi:hypothetical protein KAF25_007030 [Fusarium avenaceum]|uniref:CCHC-type domain-containing protein n=1 Tax=Fusarium avenaceum TaxID=40199 RepID=A0A9P7KQC0_9HYPO|nr:hypothetical protein KAF25_007030 [Fusarium avenaceum]
MLMSTYYRGGRGGWRDGRCRDDVRCHHCRHYGHRSNECRLLLREQLLQAYNYQAQAFGSLRREQLLQMYNFQAGHYGFEQAGPAAAPPVVIYWAALDPAPVPALLALSLAGAAAPRAPGAVAPDLLQMYNYQGGQYGFPPGAAAAPAPAAPPGPALPAPAAPGPALPPGFPYPTATSPSPGPPAPSGEGGSEMEIS